MVLLFVLILVFLGFYFFFQGTKKITEPGQVLGPETLSRESEEIPSGFPELERYEQALARARKIEKAAFLTMIVYADVGPTVSYFFELPKQGKKAMVVYMKDVDGTWLEPDVSTQEASTTEYEPLVPGTWKLSFEEAKTRAWEAADLEAGLQEKVSIVSSLDQIKGRKIEWEITFMDLASQKSVSVKIDAKTGEVLGKINSPERF